MRMPYLFIMLSLCFSSAVIGQGHCGHNEMTELLIKQDPSMLEEVQRFEAERPILAAQNGISRMGKIIPVVVHVIHSGESVGSGSNVSATRIQSQIDILNADFQRLNADANQTPSNFQSVASNTGIEFGLAAIDESGNPTTGITRHLYPNIPDTDFIENTIKPATNWDPLNYLNVWVVNIPSSTIIGYSYLPTQTMVGSDRDGLVVTVDKFGYINSNNRGRTATHEIGHYLGLQHMWGANDNQGNPIGCGSDDGISDTPNSDGPYFGCPTGGFSCNSTDMFMNYMDYTEDYCMNLFTNGQSSVMNGILDGIRLQLTQGNLTNGNLECQSVANGYDFGFEPSQSNASWSTVNNNNDDRTWIITDQSSSDWGPNNGVGMAIYLFNPDYVTPADDYLFSPCMSLEQGHDYRLTFSVTAAEDVNNFYPEKLEVGFSENQGVSDFYVPSNDWVFNPINSIYPTYQTYERVFTVNNDLEISIGFHAFSDADRYALQLDDIRIDDLGLVSTKLPTVQDAVQVVPNPTQGFTEVLIDRSILSGEVEILVYNSLGALVKQEIPLKGALKSVVDIGGFTSGVYFFHISDGKSTSIHKVIKH